MKQMFSEVEFTRDVAICAKHFNNLSPPHQHILHKLLRDLKREKACKDHGFYLGITALKSIGRNNKDNNNSHKPHILIFPVSFTCRTFLPSRRGIFQGIVKKVTGDGVFIKSGPLRHVYLWSFKMPGYHYVPAQSEGEKPYFQKDDLSKIAVGIVLRFKAISVQFREWPNSRRKDIYVLASIEGDALGPISLTGPEYQIIRTCD